MSRSRDLANLANNASGLETLTVSDITDLTATATELNYVDGVSSALQTQIDAKIGSSDTFNGTIGNATFPAGHIVQSVLNPTITNTSTTKNTTNTSVGVADVINQISITSGNGVLIYVMCNMAIVDNGNAYGRIEICEGTVASIGNVLKDNRFGLGGNPGNFNIPFSMWAYDSSPADTTPDYVVTIAKDSGSTTSAGLATDSSVRLTIFLFEVKQ